MSVLKVGEIGKLILVNANYDLSSNSDLQLKFTKPDQTTLTVDVAGGVSAPATPVTVDVDGVSTVFNANEYFQYATGSGDLSLAGNWTVNGIYIDATPKLFCGDTAAFVVLPC